MMRGDVRCVHPNKRMSEPICHFTGSMKIRFPSMQKCIGHPVRFAIMARVFILKELMKTADGLGLSMVLKMPWIRPNPPANLM